MQGLRTQEDSKFEKFFEIVQNTAKKHGFVFFLDAGDGNDIITDEMEGEDLQGWIVPENEAKDFEKKFVAFEDKMLNNKFYGFAIWYKSDEQIKIRFEQYDKAGGVRRFS